MLSYQHLCHPQGVQAPLLPYSKQAFYVVGCYTYHSVLWKKFKLIIFYTICMMPGAAIEQMQSCPGHVLVVINQHNLFALFENKVWTYDT